MISRNSFMKRTLPMMVQCAEAHRKPRWLPVAKSKVYRIPKRPEVSEEERKELLRVNNNYKTQMRAIRWFYHEEMIKEKSTLASASSEMSQQLENEEWERCVALNSQWNEQAARDREERRRRELDAMEQHALARMEAEDKKRKETLEKASAEIRLQKDLSSTFITPETLDAAIDHALANQTDYTFSIDLRGNQYHGRDAPTTPAKEEQKTPTNA